MPHMRVGKGAFAPCPPCLAGSSSMVGTLPPSRVELRRTWSLCPPYSTDLPGSAKSAELRALAGMISAKSRAPKREFHEPVFGRRHCEERLRRSNPWLIICRSIDCFAELVMGAHSRDPLARNDGVGWASCFKF